VPARAMRSTTDIRLVLSLISETVIPRPKRSSLDARE
jgi:hypothetical protein